MNKIFQGFISSEFYKFSIFLIFIVVLLFNILTPMWNDEYSFSFSIFNENEKISSIKDIIKSQIAFYQKFSGRVILHSIVQFFCWVGKDYFNIINSFVFIAIPIVINRISNSKNTGLFILLTAIIWFFAPAPSDTLFWLSGSINYSWSTLFLLFYIYHYTKNHSNRFLFVFAFIVGALHEVVFVSVFIFSMFYLILEFLRTRKIDKKHIILLMFNISGGLFLFFAPGNLNRKELMYGIIESSQSFNYFKLYYFEFIYKILPLLICVIISSLINFLRYREFKNENNSLQISLLFAGLITPLSLFFSPEAAERTLFAPVLLIISSLSISLFSFKDKIGEQFLNSKIKFSSIFFLCYFLFSTTSQLPDFINVFIHNANNILKIQNGKRVNSETIELEPIITKSKYIFTFNPKFDTSYVVNKNISKFFEVNSVRMSGDFIELILHKPVASSFAVSYMLNRNNIIKEVGEVTFIFNNYDGNRVYFNYNCALDNFYTFQFGDIPNKLFKIKAIKIHKGKRVFTFKGATLLNTIIERKLIKYNDDLIEFITKGDSNKLKFHLDTLNLKP